MSMEQHDGWAANSRGHLAEESLKTLAEPEQFDQEVIRQLNIASTGQQQTTQLNREPLHHSQGLDLRLQPPLETTASKVFNIRASSTPWEVCIRYKFQTILPVDKQSNVWTS
jgi:hypothetical protein